jgi:hypothetical protein
LTQTSVYPREVVKMSAHAYRPEITDLLEMERGMPGIRFEKFVVLVGKSADIGR